ncbi:MAG TPA: sugar phosphate isomerase/epimerase [Fimbriiglobus sp.]
MYVACSTLCFGSKPFGEAMKTIRDYQFPKVDLVVRPDGPHLTPADVLAGPTQVAQRLKAQNVPVAAISLTASAPDGIVARAELKACCRLARLLSVPLVAVPAAPLGSDFETEVGRLTDWVKIANAEGVILTVETHSATLTADPTVALELCRSVRGLGITLDPSHYHSGPNGPANYDPLFPFVRHVRLRDSGPRPDQFQVQVGQGDVEYGRIVNQLDRCHYDRALTVDVRDVPPPGFPVDSEVRKLKYLLESLV